MASPRASPSPQGGGILQWEYCLSTRSHCVFKPTVSAPTHETLDYSRTRKELLAPNESEARPPSRRGPADDANRLTDSCNRVARHQGLREQTPAVDRDEKQQLERKTHLARIGHLHSESQKNVGNHEIDHDKWEEDREP